MKEAALASSDVSILFEVAPTMPHSLNLWELAFAFSNKAGVCRSEA
jgi:hypothetical protein